MKKVICAVLGVGFLWGAGVGVQAAHAGELVATFDDNSVPSWMTMSTTDYGALSVTNQRVEVTITGNGAGSGGLSLNQAVSGDFDARVDFSLLNWPVNNDVRLGLGGQNAGILATTTFFNYFGSNLNYYVVNFNGGLYPSSWVQTGDNGGSLRLTREGERFSAYYGSEGNWNLLGYLDNVNNVPSVPVGFAAWTYQGYPAGTKVAFDNFRISGTTIVPEPASSAAFLLGAGALAVRRVRRKRA